MIPKFSHKTKLNNSREYLFDELRKKWVIITPEEIVRQNCWKYLHYEKKYPKSLMVVEKKVLINGLNKRFDILIYNNLGNPEIIVECKAPNVKINDSVLSQILNYQKKIRAKYLLITNGLESYFLKVNSEKRKCEYLEKVPICNFF